MKISKTQLINLYLFFTGHNLMLMQKPENRRSLSFTKVRKLIANSIYSCEYNFEDINMFDEDLRLPNKSWEDGDFKDLVLLNKILHQDLTMNHLQFTFLLSTLLKVVEFQNEAGQIKFGKLIEYFEGRRIHDNEEFEEEGLNIISDIIDSNFPIRRMLIEKVYN